MAKTREQTASRESNAPTLVTAARGSFRRRAHEELKVDYALANPPFNASEIRKAIREPEGRD